MVDPDDTAPDVEDKMTDVIERRLFIERAFRPGQMGNTHAIPVRKPDGTSWLVSDEDGDELFTTQSASFLEWWMDAHPTHSMKEI